MKRTEPAHGPAEEQMTGTGRQWDWSVEGWQPHFAEDTEEADDVRENVPESTAGHILRTNVVRTPDRCVSSRIPGQGESQQSSTH